MRVLIAEDERITRASLARQLERWGHIVVATENGREAMERFREEPFDIVLTDWEMPELSGLELIQQIRSIESSDYVYIILLTSRTDKSDVVSGIEAGSDDFVSKPFDREELRVRLLAGERVVRLERTLTTQNEELRAAGARMRRDLGAAARVQRAMLPKVGIEHERVRASFDYVPTDELAGDGIGFHLIDGRYLVAYVVDVAGHGVPAALLAVTAMHALSPAAGGMISTSTGDHGPSPAGAVSALNRRFCAGDTDGRFLTMILCVLDTQDGVLRFSRAGHPLPVIARHGAAVGVDDCGGLPLGIVADEEYRDVEMKLEAGDRIFLYSDGVAEQIEAAGQREFGDDRLTKLFVSSKNESGALVLAEVIEALTQWAGTDQFADDVSLIAIEWSGV